MRMSIFVKFIFMSLLVSAAMSRRRGTVSYSPSHELNCFVLLQVFFVLPNKTLYAQHDSIIKVYFLGLRPPTTLMKVGEYRCWGGGGGGGGGGQEKAL